ncbi:phosphotransferase family protein [Sphingosinicella soli]|uniref:Aminoglycoside phosphotransferase (APT) family kinase protein n=1 Tax=Sphingosinicella soli TaxID=333708 RepID=A0A7W7B2W2_9SPHN|nr:phosphotransferase family protein [Sphingosinicella soli]MBB4632983.1 aminoglycoside phosphotransferase (APT) family kinase protein [Sphingosinicella soli]
MEHDRTDPEAARARLARVLERAVPGHVDVEAVIPLSGGANSLTYAVDAVRDGQPWRLILQVTPPGQTTDGMPRAVQAALQTRAGNAGVRVAPVIAVLTPQDGLGEGFVMAFVEGETLAPRWLRDDGYAQARAAMLADCAESLARIHAIGAEAVTDLSLSVRTPQAQLDDLREIYDRCDGAVPVFELAFAELAARLPGGDLTLVHGDFRSGNFIVGESGLAAVVDWELAHIGHPLLDLGWLSTNTWRFGQSQMPVGGFAEREAFYAAYEAAGGRPVDRESVLAFEMLGSLRWGVMCMQMGAAHLSGDVASVERAAIARRVSETEADILYMLKHGAL